MDLSGIGRNDPCPCGSGKKFKHCHLGREDELLAANLQMDPGEMARRIFELPECDHPRAREMAAQVVLTSAAGKEIRIRLKDLDAYRALRLYGQPPQDKGPGGVFINPYKTRVLDPQHLYIALSPQADESVVVHELAHAADYVEGSALPPGRGVELAHETGLPVELLEHPQEFGERLRELAERFQVRLDDDDEIIVFLARRRMLLPGKQIARGDRQELVAAAEKTLRFMRENQQEINNRLSRR